MKLFAAALASLFVGAAASAQAQQPDIGARRLSLEDVRSVAHLQSAHFEDVRRPRQRKWSGR